MAAQIVEVPGELLARAQAEIVCRLEVVCGRP